MSEPPSGPRNGYRYHTELRALADTDTRADTLCGVVWCGVVLLLCAFCIFRVARHISKSTAQQCEYPGTWKLIWFEDITQKWLSPQLGLISPAQQTVWDVYMCSRITRPKAIENWAWQFFGILLCFIFGLWIAPKKREEIELGSCFMHWEKRLWWKHSKYVLFIWQTLLIWIYGSGWWPKMFVLQSDIFSQYLPPSHWWTFSGYLGFGYNCLPLEWSLALSGHLRVFLETKAICSKGFSVAEDQWHGAWGVGHGEWRN